LFPGLIGLNVFFSFRFFQLPSSPSASIFSSPLLSSCNHSTFKLVSVAFLVPISSCSITLSPFGPPWTLFVLSYQGFIPLHIPQFCETPLQTPFPPPPLSFAASPSAGPAGPPLLAPISLSFLLCAVPRPSSPDPQR